MRDKDGNLVHYRQTEEGRRTSFGLKDSGYSVNYRKTVEGRRKSSLRVSETNLKYDNHKDSYLYIIRFIRISTGKKYFKVGTTDNLSRRFWFFTHSEDFSPIDIFVSQDDNSALIEFEFHREYQMSKGSDELLGIYGINGSEWYPEEFYSQAFRILESKGCKFVPLKYNFNDYLICKSRRRNNNILKW